MEKKVTRKEVNLYLGEKESRPTSSSKLAAQGKNLIVGNTNYQLPDADSLAQKYGVESDFKSNNASVEHIEIIQKKEQKISELETAVGSLKTKIEEKNRKIESLCVMLEALEPTPGINPQKIQEVLQGRIAEEEVDLRDGKIVSLAKKSHKLTMQVNKEKTINAQLTDEINDWKRRYDALLDELEIVRNNLQQRNETKVYHRSQLESGSSKKNANATDSSNPDDDNNNNGNNLLLQKQLKESLKLVDDLKKKVKDLSDENATLAKTLKKELGEGISLEQAVDSGWRGRAQQIVMLKSKIKQLEANPYNNGNGGTSRRANDVDTKAEEGIVEMSRERRQIVEQLTEERVQLMEANQTLEKKTIAQKARIQILENEVKKVKESIQVALDKSNNDDQLIEALREEIKRLQQRLGRSQEEIAQLKEKKGKFSSSMMQQSMDDSQMRSTHISMEEQEWNQKEQQYQSELKRLKRLCQNQADQLESQDVTIRDLRKQLKPF